MHVQLHVENVMDLIYNLKIRWECRGKLRPFLETRR